MITPISIAPILSDKYNEYANIGNIGKRVKHSTHELSSGKLESRVADIGVRVGGWVFR
jgi:hypothetical protein